MDTLEYERPDGWRKVTFDTDYCEGNENGPGYTFPLIESVFVLQEDGETWVQTQEADEHDAAYKAAFDAIEAGEKDWNDSMADMY